MVGSDEAQVVAIPWSERFDLIASEYGWTDDQILDLTPARVRLCSEAIARRLFTESGHRAMLQELHAKAIIVGLAGLAQSKKGSKGIQKYAKSLQFWKRDDEVEELPTTESIKRMFPSG